jgi:hypothetical protein
MLGITQPIRPIGDKGPGSYLGNARRQSIEVSVDTVELGNMAAEPFFRDVPCPDDKTIDRKHEFRMRARR